MLSVAAPTAHMLAQSPHAPPARTTHHRFHSTHDGSRPRHARLNNALARAAMADSRTILRYTSACISRTTSRCTCQLRPGFNLVSPSLMPYRPHYSTSSPSVPPHHQLTTCHPPHCHRTPTPAIPPLPSLHCHSTAAERFAHSVRWATAAWRTPVPST